MRDQAADTREAQAAREVGHTEVRPAVARVLTVAFLLALGSVAGLELARDARRGAGSVWRELLAAPARAWRTAAEQGLLAGNRQLLADMTAFEETLDERSEPARRALPQVQWVLTRWLGAGNEQVLVGRQGWLYFRPAVDYLTGPGFLEPRGLARRASQGRASQRPRQPDPLPALADFAAQLAERGIGLVLLPTPVKAALHPEGLTRGLAGADLPLENPSFDEFLERLDELEIPVYAPGPRLAAGDRSWPRFLRTDTHWTPQAVEETAAGLAEFLGRRPLPEAYGAAYVRTAVGVTGRGDLAALLRSPLRRPLFRPEPVVVRRVTSPAGEPWRPDPAADILLMGDSFSNVYSQPELGWGDSAGLAEQLSYVLGRPLDKLAVNAGGPAAVRERLAERLAAGDDRLAGKRLVVYQFTARELAAGDWRLVDLASDRPAPGRRARRPEQALPARGLAVWESNRSGEWRIWTRRLEGSLARQLTPDEPGLQHCCPHLSPDGSQLAYLSRRAPRDEYPEENATGELRILDARTGQQRTVVAAARAYGWGNRAVVWRDERELVYVGADGRTFLLDLSTGRSRALTDEPRRKLAWLLDASLRHAVLGSPTFSSYDPATRQIAEGRRRAGCEPYFTHDGRFGFWVEGAGGPIRRIELRTGAVGTLIEQEDPRLPSAQRYVYFPMVSRDGRLLAFGASAGDHDHFRSNYDIFVAPLDPGSFELRGRPLRLTAHPASDRYPDVHVESLELERWQREHPAAPAAGASRAAPAPAPGPLEARAELRACSRLPSLREISPYRAALLVCEWDVTELLAGESGPGRVRAAHWGWREGQRQPIASAAPGLAARLRLEPLAGTAQIEGYPISNTLAPARELPLYYAREP